MDPIEFLMKAAFAKNLSHSPEPYLSRGTVLLSQVREHEQVRQLIQEAREQHDLINNCSIYEASERSRVRKTFSNPKAEVQLHRLWAEEKSPLLTDEVTLACLGDEPETATAAYRKDSETAIPVSPR